VRAGGDLELLQTDLKYEGYAAASLSRINARRKRNQKIPDGLDYDKIAGLRSEPTEAISLRPTSLGQAARISGITPSDIFLLHIWLNRNSLLIICERQKGRNCAAMLTLAVLLVGSYLLARSLSLFGWSTRRNHIGRRQW